MQKPKITHPRMYSDEEGFLGYGIVIDHGSRQTMLMNQGSILTRPTKAEAEEHAREFVKEHLKPE